MTLNQQDKYRLRVIYAKSGRLIYLSHLEVLRAIQYSVRRAGLPFLVTNGFSPRMRISFGPALGQGIESHSEYFDVFLSEYIAIDKIDLAKACPFEIVDYFYVDNDIEQDYSPIKYRALFDEITDYDIPEYVEHKHRKKYIKDYLEEFSVKDNQVFFSLKTSSKGSIKPELFLQSVFPNSKIQKLYKL